MAEIEVRPALTADVRQIQARRKVDELSFSLSLQQAEAGTAWAAFDESEPIGVCVAHDSQDERYIGDLFVEPSFRGQAIGSRLIDAAFEEIGDRSRSVAVDSRDAAGLAIALRRSLPIQATVLQLAGAIPREEALMKMAAGDYRFEVDTIDPARHGPALDALDREVRGTARPSDHEAFAAASTGQAFFLNGEMVGYAYVWPDGRIGPMATSSGAYIVQIFGFVLVTVQRTYGASWCSALVPASNVRAARAALRASLRIDDTFSFASDGGFAGDFSRYIARAKLVF